MKKSKILLVVLATLMLTASCKKKLKEYNPGGLTDENIYTTKDGFNSLVNGAYSFQRFWYGKEAGYAITEAGTDLWAPGKNYSARTYRGLFDYSLMSDNSVVQAEWTKFYQAINLCNIGLSKISEVGFNADDEKRLKGELSFLRAFYLWHIVETWGEVPFSTTKLTSYSKLKLDVLYGYIIADLEFACSALGAKNTYGRAHRDVARAFLSRVYLTRGYGKEHIYSYFTQDNSYFQKAIDTAKTLVGKYTMMTNYQDLWKIANVKNTEVIYALDYSNVSLDNYIGSPTATKEQYDKSFPLYDNSSANINQYGGHNGHLFFNHTYDAIGSRTLRCLEYGRPFARYAPTKYLLGLYNDTIDARFSASFQTLWFATTTGSTPVPVAGDTSILISKTKNVRLSSKYKSFSIDSMYDANTGKFKSDKMCPTFLKFMDNTRATVAVEYSERDAFIIRYPEVLLIIAEAYIKLGQQGDAVEFVNKVRTRAAKTGKVAEMQVTVDNMTIDFILDERAREFAGEQMRWFDLNRTGKLEERVKAYNPNIADAFQAPKHYVRPIPQSEVSAGGAIQSTGY